MKVLAALSLLLFVLGAPLTSQTQQVPTLPRVGWLWTGPASPHSPYLEAFREGMRALKYVEGQSYVLDTKYTDGKNEMLPELVGALVRARTDVIVAGPAPALLAAKQITTTIPLVMTLGADPVSFGVAGGNVTGLTEITPQLTGRRLQLLKEIAPSLKRVAILWQPGSLRDETLKQARVDAENEAQSSAIGVTIVEAREPGDLEAAFSLMATNHIDAVIVLVSPMFNVQRKQIIDRAAALGKPTIYEWKEFVQSGGLISYGADLLDVYRRAASFVDRLLKRCETG